MIVNYYKKLFLFLTLLVSCEGWVPSKSKQSQSYRKQPSVRENGTGHDEALTSSELTTANTAESKKIYSMPALYDLAFGYRDYEDEVNFLLQKHKQYNQITTPSKLRILELAAGPARHSITALNVPDGSVDAVVCIDTSPEMKKYAEEIAEEELPNDKKTTSFRYLLDDMRSFDTMDEFDSVWILLGSLQHLTTNAELIQCFQRVAAVLKQGGTVIIELPHPREVFKMGECTRNGWEVPLDDADGTEAGQLQIVWGDDGDEFDPIQQIRQFTISMELSGCTIENMDATNVYEVVPMRLITAQEIEALARCCNLDVVARYGALEYETIIDVNDEERAYRLVCILRKK